MDTILKHKYKYTFVFEDDFIFTTTSQEFDEKINKFLDEYGNDWDIIQLSSHYISTKDTDLKDIKKVHKASTSSAYLINYHFVKKLKAKLSESLKNMEKEMIQFNKKNNNKLRKKYETRYALDQDWYSLQKKSEWYLFKPFLGKQGGKAGNSSIMNSRVEEFTNKAIRFYQLKC